MPCNWILFVLLSFIVVVVQYSIGMKLSFLFLLFKRWMLANWSILAGHRSGHWQRWSWLSMDAGRQIRNLFPGFPEMWMWCRFLKWLPIGCCELFSGCSWKEKTLSAFRKIFVNLSANYSHLFLDQRLDDVRPLSQCVVLLVAQYENPGTIWLHCSIWQNRVEIPEVWQNTLIKPDCEWGNYCQEFLTLQHPESPSQCLRNQQQKQSPGQKFCTPGSISAWHARDQGHQPTPKMPRVVT